jgi:hypothetical protein
MRLYLHVDIESYERFFTRKIFFNQGIVTNRKSCIFVLDYQLYMKKILLVLSLFCLIILGFVFNPFQPKNTSPIKAFYYWKNYDGFWYDSETLDTLQVRKLYVKYFEVDYDPDLGPIPVSKTELTISRTEWDYEKDKEVLSSNARLNIVPTVFILNSVFKEPGLKTREMAKDILFLISKKHQENMQGFSSPKEIQIDCDWTESTKKVYMRFLRELKQEMKKKQSLENTQLSATLRLYAYKFPDRMGVLPVDRAMLMCYNLLTPRESGKRNSILDLEELKKYLIGADAYPIPLDVALPTYSNVQVFQNKQFKSLFYKEDSTFLSYLKPLKPPFYLISKDTLVDEVYLRKGDRLKVERVSAKQIRAAIDVINREVYFEDRPTMALFHLDSDELRKYTHEELVGFYKHLR